MAAPNRPPNPTSHLINPSSATATNPFAAAPSHRPAGAALFAARALTPNPPSLNPNPNPNPNHTIPHGILYPVSTRGHPPSGPPSVASLPTVAGVNPTMYTRTAAPASTLITSQMPLHHQHQHQHQQQQQQHRFVYAGNDVQHQHQVRPNVLPSFNVPRAAGTSGPPPLKGVPIATHAKGQTLTNMAQTLEYMLGRDRDRDRNNDDSFIMINDRKVRLTDGEPCSLYSLCRSWVRNGAPVETHSNYYGHNERILPRPLPASIADSDEVKKDEKKQEENEDAANDEDGAAVEPYTTRSLLEEHIKRAKRIRAKLTKERLVRIRRYKQRLALLLPSTELANNAITAKLE